MLDHNITNKNKFDKLDFDKPSVVITQEEYDALLDSDKLLCALQNAGVDNWEGYDEALKLYHEEE